MAKRSKEEREEERKKELLRTLRRGPDLDRFIDEQKRRRHIRMDNRWFSNIWGRLRYL